MMDAITDNITYTHENIYAEKGTELIMLLFPIIFYL